MHKTAPVPPPHQIILPCLFLIPILQMRKRDTRQNNVHMKKGTYEPQQVAL